MSYLKFDRTWKAWGRILKMEVTGPHLKIKLHSGQQFQTLYLEEHEILKNDDWVAVNKNGQIIQVTPNQGEMLVKKVDSETLRMWNEYLSIIRLFFARKNFIELQTPSLVVCPGTEPTLESFETSLKIGSKVERRFLPTSPELHLKKALCMGYERIFEIAKCYRNSEVTDVHQPEFWMLEWYRSFANIFDIEKDCVSLIYFVADHLKVSRPMDVECVTIPRLFKKILNVDLRPDMTKADYLSICRNHDCNFREDYSIDDLFFLLMLEKIEPMLPQDKLVFVEKYPPFQAALARKDEDGWSERFEVYWKGMELANAFDELNDPIEQRARASEDILKREGRNPIHLDEEFFKALRSGMPPAAGIALGLERLFMALLGIRKIQDLRVFPIRPD